MCYYYKLLQHVIRNIFMCEIINVLYLNAFHHSKSNHHPDKYPPRHRQSTYQGLQVYNIKNRLDYIRFNPKKWQARI